MEPLSITVSVSSLIVVCTRIIKFSSDLSSSYRSASFMLSAITAECGVISASLTRLQNMLLSQPDRLGTLAESLETALLGCALTMSVLQEQIGGLANETKDGDVKPKKFKFVLEQDHLKELLQQIRGQQISITLLLQTYQNDSLTEVKQSIQDYNVILQQMANKGLSLWRGTHSSGQQHATPAAIVSNGETDSVFELSSIITDTRFDFDDQVLDSRAYRGAMMHLRHAQKLREAEGADDEDEHRDDMLVQPGDHQSEGVERDSMDSGTKKLPSADIGPPSHGEGPQTMEVSRPEEIDPGAWESIPSDGQVRDPQYRPYELPALQLHLPPDTETGSFSQQFGNMVLSNDVDSHIDPSLPAPSTSQEQPDGEASTLSTNPHQKSSSRWQRLIKGRKAQPMSAPTPLLYKQRKLVIVGDSGSGKTPLLIVFCKGVFVMESIPTLFENYAGDVEVDGNHVQLGLWDTAGIEDYDRLRGLSYPDAHVILVCFSLANQDNYENVQEKWISEVLHFCKGVPIILVGTKKDLRDDGKVDVFAYEGRGQWITPEEGEALRQKIGAQKYLECSALRNEGVREVFETAARLALKTPRFKRRR